ncbi:hypothetical protein ACLB2K_053108 [Fragaria x ananassa]
MGDGFWPSFYVGLLFVPNRFNHIASLIKQANRRVNTVSTTAKHFEINPKFNSCVQSARYDETIEFWRVNTVSTTGSTRSEVECVCRWLIAATGENAECVGPDIDGLCEFGCEMFKGLVVGCGNPGMEINLDLCNHNASPSIVVGSSVQIRAPNSSTPPPSSTPPLPADTDLDQVPERQIEPPRALKRLKRGLPEKRELPTTPFWSVEDDIEEFFILIC